jgi:hypothetical protein
MLATDATKEMNPTTRISAPAAQHHSHLSFVDARRGWYAEDRGTILHTVDGGDHWMPQNSGTKSNLISIQFLPDGKRGWAVGDNGVILQTADGGIRWQSQRSGVKQILQGIQFLPDGRHGWAVIARGGMLHTTDGGVHWQLLCEQRNGQLCGAQFLADGARGWAISYQGMIWHTSDGGKTWQIQLILPKDTFIRGWVPRQSTALPCCRMASMAGPWATKGPCCAPPMAEHTGNQSLEAATIGSWVCTFKLMDRKAGSLVPTVFCCVP